MKGTEIKKENNFVAYYLNGIMVWYVFHDWCSKKWVSMEKESFNTPEEAHSFWKNNYEFLAVIAGTISGTERSVDIRYAQDLAWQNLSAGLLGIKDI